MSIRKYLETLPCRGELQCIKDENEILKNINNYNIKKIIDVCHPTHPKLLYECFEEMKYLPIHEISADNLKEANNDKCRGYIAKISNKDELELVLRENKNVVAFQLTTDHTFDSVDTLIKLTNHKIYISFPNEITDEFTNFLTDLVKKSPVFTIFVPLSIQLMKLNQTLLQYLIITSVFVLSETSENLNMALLTRVLPLNQVVIGFPHRKKFLKEDVDPSKTLELIKEIIEYLAAVKEIDEDLIIRATAFNSLKYLPKIKIINENVEALKKRISEQQSETEKEFQYLSEVFDTTTNDIIQEYEKEIESLKDKLQHSESLFNKIANFKLPGIVPNVKENICPLPSSPLTTKTEKWTKLVESLKSMKSASQTIIPPSPTQIIITPKPIPTPTQTIIPPKPTLTQTIIPPIPTSTQTIIPPKPTPTPPSTQIIITPKPIPPPTQTHHANNSDNEGEVYDSEGDECNTKSKRGHSCAYMIRFVKKQHAKEAFSNRLENIKNKKHDWKIAQRKLRRMPEKNNIIGRISLIFYTGVASSLDERFKLHYQETLANAWFPNVNLKSGGFLYPMRDDLQKHTHMKLGEMSKSAEKKLVRYTVLDKLTKPEAKMVELLTLVALNHLRISELQDNSRLDEQNREDTTSVSCENKNNSIQEQSQQSSFWQAIKRESEDDENNEDEESEDDENNEDEESQDDETNEDKESQDDKTNEDEESENNEAPICDYCGNSSNDLNPFFDCYVCEECFENSMLS
ncbi:hypothetical protein FO519_009263, partial [Halicephalobus sp. NKZ332]